MNDYGNDFITVTDDDGNEFELEHLDTVEISNELYMAFVPADMDEDDDDYGLVILKVVTDGDEDVLTTVDDDEMLSIAYELFLQRMSATDDEYEQENEDEAEDETQDADEDGDEEADGE